MPIDKKDQNCNNCYYPKNITVNGVILRLCRFPGPVRGVGEHKGHLVDLDDWCGQWRDESWSPEDPQNVQMV
jgi:hypothetical protein